MPEWSERAYLLLPLLAANVYALAALGFKSARQGGCQAWHMTLTANAMSALAFLVFVPWTQPQPWPSSWGQPVALGAVFFLGQLFTMLALTRGDVSVATPLLGTKSILVAFLLAAAFAQPVGITVWIAAVLAVLGVTAIQRTDQPTHLTHPVLTITYSLLAAAAFAVFDVLTQVWSKELGYGRLMPPALLVAAVLSLLLMRRAPAGTPRLSNRTRGFLLLGAVLMTVQALLLITTIGLVGDAAGCNIVYGSRGLWTIILVWLVGSWFGNRELHANRRVFIWRLIGSVLILGGIVLVFVR